MFSRPSRSSICTFSSPYLGTYETYSNRWNASWQCNFSSSNWYKSLSYTSRVRPLMLHKFAGEKSNDVVQILHRLKYGFLSELVDGK